MAKVEGGTAAKLFTQSDATISMCCQNCSAIRLFKGAEPAPNDSSSRACAA